MSKCKNLLVALALVSGSVTAASLPTGYDEIRTADGTTCRASTASTTYLTTEVYRHNDDRDNYAQDELGIKMSIIIPLGGGIDSRVDCTRFAELELQRMQAELERTKAELKALQSQQTTWE